ncbi:LysE family transporter [Streptomyces heilongjiangensis]|uniref:LysE family transporter n=1 Tax=Streptomyces heilongjiangensis TaxID=945052 RepID=A0ABW1AZD5_9ACTN|nr:LysE family transporter [Streptomyces heilongjiangensis]MDC2946364.1 LysE family transporter [Streptomyces heilongjiangensis]
MGTDTAPVVTAALVAGLLAGYGIAIPVGAVATCLVSLTARTSLRTGVCAALGVATADGLYALLAALGGTALAVALQPVLLPLRRASALVLLALAVRGAVTVLRRYRARHLPAGPQRDAVSPARAYATLLGITLLNPTTVVYFTALVLGTRATEAVRPPEQAVFVLAALVASASWQLLLAGGGALLGRALTGHRGRLATGLVSSAVIAVLAARMLLTS